MISAILEKKAISATFVKTKKMSVQPEIKQPFSNIQLELLKLYSRNLSEEDLLAIKDLLAKFFFEKAKDAADKAWDEKGLTEDMLLKLHQRTPYRRKQ